MDINGREFYTRAARERIRQGDVFAEPAFVVPVMTRGRAYGSISKAIQARGIVIPDLKLRETAVETYNGKTVIFLAFWDDTTPYSNAHVTACVDHAMGAASNARVPFLAIPLLGGKEWEKYLSAMEFGVEQAEQTFDVTGFNPVEVSFMTQNTIT